MENEQAWKIDFKAIKQEAEAKAQPHWDKAESLDNEASALGTQIKDLRVSIKGEKRATVREKVETKIRELNGQIEQLNQQAKGEKAAGDRHYWPIYNLDIKNPNAPGEESHDPDKLLEQYKELLAEIEETQNQLKHELSAALSHHFDAEESAQ